MLRPFVKWLGGKTQLLDKITPQIPEDTEVYVEPFLGGGAVLLNQLENNNIKLFIASDININLIDAYNCIKFNHSYFLLKDELNHIAEQFNSTDKKKEYYYERRKEYNYLIANPPRIEKLDAGNIRPTDYLVRKSALFIFINKTGFNGLYRVNKKGEFNAAFNNAKHFYPDFTNLENLHKFFLNKEVVFLNESYENTLEYIENKLEATGYTKCFVYLDPPYKPVKKNGKGVSYNVDEFDDSKQEQLKAFCDKLTEKGIKFLESNSDPDDSNYFEDLYSKYNITRVKANRKINCDAKGRGAINELLIKNY